MGGRLSVAMLRHATQSGTAVYSLSYKDSISFLDTQAQAKYVLKKSSQYQY